MTTTANKQGLKAAAAKRTAKHAQRTPLPPRASEADVQANIAELVAESPSARYGMMTVAQLKAEAKSLGLVTYTLRTKGALLNALLARTNKQAEERREALAEAKVDATFQPAQPGDEIVIDNFSAAQDEAMATIVPSSKSGAKAEAFAAKARQLGWTTTFRDLQANEDRVLCVATRASGQPNGTEAITIEWLNGVFDNQTCFHTTPGGRALKLRNASHALKRMALAPADVVREDTKVGLHKTVARKASQAASGTPSAPTPYFADDTPDAEVLASVVGKSITWINGLSGGLETDLVQRPSLTGEIQMKRPGTPERSINFLGRAGFRTVRVSAIVSL